ncbi:MAG: PEP-CTERM sorting domain-containing protein [Betaproteobacteria bacterium]|nr:PEP-CTERM sorting domain-containing protein [Betaproteobacteria bacterium]
MTSLRAIAGLALLASASIASAHVSYNNRDFFAAPATFDGVDTYTLTGLRVASNFSWADAADADWGDSHKGRFLKFTLTEESFVTLSVSAQNDPGLGLGDLIPAFSLYSGLIPAASHEGATAPAYLAHHPGFLPGTPYAAETGKLGDKEGAWNGLGNFWMANDNGDAAEVTFIGYAIDGAGVDVNGDRNAQGQPIIDYAGDGSANQSVSGTWKLAAGSYTVAVGGACYTCQYTEDPSTWGSNRVFSASLTLAPVPEPETWALTGAGLALMLLATRGRRAQR